MKIKIVVNTNNAAEARSIINKVKTDGNLIEETNMFTTFIFTTDQNLLDLCLEKIEKSFQVCGCEQID